MTAAIPGVRGRGLWTYENGLVFLISLANGVVTLDRLAVSFLSPYIVAEFHISNTEVGLLASTLSVAIAASGFLLARFADRSGRRKGMLILMMVLFSVASALSGLAGSFLVLLAARILLGLAEGPIAPIAQSIVAIESSEHRRGFNMGVVLNFGMALIGVAAGPILATHIAEAFGWRAAFFASCVPGLLIAMAFAAWLRPTTEPPRSASTLADAERAGAAGLLQVMKSRNMLLCILISGLFSAWLIVQSVFLPLYLTGPDRLSPTQMGLVIGITGPAVGLGGMIVPALSDRFGRKPVLALITLFGVVSPLVTLMVPPAGPWLAAGLFIGTFAGGAGPLYVAAIPSESVPRRHVATAVAVSLAAGEIIGGVISPTLAGRAADVFGLQAPFWISAGCAVACCGLSLLLVETAPRKVAGP